MVVKRKKTAKYYLDNKDVLKQKAKDVYRNLSEKRKLSQKVVFKR